VAGAGVGSGKTALAKPLLPGGLRSGCSWRGSPDDNAHPGGAQSSPAALVQSGARADPGVETGGLPPTPHIRETASINRAGGRKELDLTAISSNLILDAFGLKRAGRHTGDRGPRRPTLVEMPRPATLGADRYVAGCEDKIAAQGRSVAVNRSDWFGDHNIESLLPWWGANLEVMATPTTDAHAWRSDLVLQPTLAS